jgi:hypothetical protein
MDADAQGRRVKMRPSWDRLAAGSSGIRESPDLFNKKLELQRIPGDLIRLVVMPGLDLA